MKPVNAHVDINITFTRSGALTEGSLALRSGTQMHDVMFLGVLSLLF